MWVRRTATGWRLARPLELAAWIVSIGSCGVILLVIYAAIFVSPVELLYLPFLAVVAFGIGRLAMMRVDVTEGGLRIVNPSRTALIPWHEFDGFSVGRWRQWRCMALAIQCSGDPIPIGVLTISPFYYDTRVEDAVHELQSDIETRIGPTRNS